jgi:hypothetical protein
MANTIFVGGFGHGIFFRCFRFPEVLMVALLKSLEPIFMLITSFIFKQTVKYRGGVNLLCIMHDMKEKERYVVKVVTSLEANRTHYAHLHLTSLFF